ncbi:hypothetical protein [Bacillus chungangensis]|uniref:Uncharacterized protein n=1 Tax=Bacillus chungangensis TaxID=587633 RepID=A0ABT9WMK6_9BACI|nr:hypothetical protein [Bacillus chungangensis]MDQ0174449.1 hypothetical protein [Bacillus chungangensis]
MTIDKTKFRSVIVNRLLRAEENRARAEGDESWHSADYYKGMTKAYRELLKVIDDWS